MPTSRAVLDYHPKRVAPLARGILAFAGLFLVALAIRAGLDSIVWPLAVLGVASLIAAVLGSAPAAGRSQQPTAGTFWTLPAHKTPSRQLFVLAFQGVAIGVVYNLFHDGWWYFTLFAAAVGLVVGAVFPLFRYRIAAWIVITVASAALMLATGPYDDIGPSRIIFIAGCFGLAYSALLWGAEKEWWLLTMERE